ncbi:MAG TPA: MYXO-CTERM sorting domain-containing protein, partial [Polyangiaceae bacterium]
TLTAQFWSTGDTRDASHAKQPWFDAVYGSYAAAPASGLDARIGEGLLGMQGAPAFERDRVNCDAGELAAGVCLAIDGTTKITLSKEKGWGGVVVADSVVPWSVRPDSDFEWRSDPFRVNGTASTRLDPGGDFLAAYWLARLSDTSTSKNVSPFARAALPWAKPDAGGPSEVPVVSSGCGCRTATPGAPDVAWVVGLVALFGLRRRRR